MGSLVKRVENLFKKIKSLQIIPLVYKEYQTIHKIAKYHSNLAIVGMTEHIGDIIASEPVARFLTQQKKQRVIWIVNKKFAELLRYNPNIYTIIEISSLSEWIYLKKLLSWKTNFPIHDLHLNLKICPQYKLQVHNYTRVDITPENYYNEGPLLTIFCLVGGLPALKMAPQFYLPPIEKRKNLNLPQKYIAIQTTSNEARRCWDLKKWEVLINYFHDFTFIELGIKPTLHCKNCISDYCGKTSLLDVAQIIEGCQLFIGIDSSFAHLANAFAQE